MTRRYRQVMLELLRDVVAGTLRNADRLPTEREIAARFACHRSVVREAVRALEERGIVDVRSGDGQYVLPDDQWNLLDRDVAAAVFRSPRDLELQREAIDALRAWETAAAKLAARHAPEGDIVVMVEMLRRMRIASGAGDSVTALDEGFVDAECVFHDTLTNCAENRWMGCPIKPLHPVLAQMRRERAPDRDGLVVALHERILVALRARAASATAAAVDEYVKRIGSWLGV